MTLQEAIALNRPFKRSSALVWRQPESDQWYTASDISAIDWEVMPLHRDINFTQLATAFDAAKAALNFNYNKNFLKEVGIELGIFIRKDNP